MDNSPLWVAIDLAAQYAGLTLVPLPAFFSASQHAHIVQTADITVLFCADSGQASALGFHTEVFNSAGLRLFERDDSKTGNIGVVPHGPIHKITFTSGTTGAPKGVCLSTEQQINAAQTLATVTASLDIQLHLSLLPFPVLLENIAGIYAPLLLGARCICPPLADVGMTGSSGFDANACLNAIAQYKPDSIILLPQMLRALVASLESKATNNAGIRTLKFVAVGGGSTPAPLILRARELGLPVYEGYGLSECASVVALNVPGADKPGTVGRTLPGIGLRLAADGEILVSGRGFGGYLDTTERATAQWLPTGDLGSCDSEGFIRITGRKKNILITSFGRNVSPEWPENLLLDDPLIRQAVVFGEGRPHLVAVLVAAAPEVDDSALNRIVATTNQKLPDYARIRTWIRASDPFTPKNELATPNGRIRRDAIWARYASQIDVL
jgi:long-chain acyl-CoA synthetase